MNRLFIDKDRGLRPLAYRIKPEKFEEFVGQSSILGEGTILKKLISKKKMVNSIFYGPPGTGKTSLALLIAKELDYDFVILNATNSGIGEIKKVAEASEKKLKIEGIQTILFLDEIHRFNKSQQDILLEYMEKGSFILVGATTENPYYTLNNALISRGMLYKFEKLNEENIKKIITNALSKCKMKLDEESIDYIASLSQGDARTSINYIELLEEINEELDLEEVKKLLGNRKKQYSKKEDKYNTISAFIKSIRGSNPDAAVYWLGKMLDGGEDPRYIARRLMVHASEDIGMANPEALNMATSAMIASERIGMPEVRIILSQVTIYLAISSKSNSSYKAINNVLVDISKGEILEVPRHLTDEYSNEYKYPHNYENNFVKQKYIDLDKRYYIPEENRNESMIREKLEKLWGWKYE